MFIPEKCLCVGFTDISDACLMSAYGIYGYNGHIYDLS